MSTREPCPRFRRGNKRETKGARGDLQGLCTPQGRVYSNSPIENQAKALNRQILLYSRRTKGRYAHPVVLNLIIHRGSAKQDHDEAAPPTPCDGSSEDRAG